MTDSRDPAGGRAPERPWPKLLMRPKVPMPRPGAPRAAEPIARGSEWTLGLLEKLDAALGATPAARIHMIKPTPRVAIAR